MGNLRLISMAAAVAVAFWSTTSIADPMKAFEGQKLFKTLCFLCHGAEGKGDGPLAKRRDIHPADLTAPKTVAKSDEELLRFIAGTNDHSPSRTMPRWGELIRDTDMEAVLVFVRFLQSSAHPLAGDPQKGGVIYRKYCAACHGEGGRGDGVKAVLLPVKPADHTDPVRMNRLDNEALADVIAHGKTYMPAWEDTLSPAEIKAVVSYIRLLSFRPPAPQRAQ